MNNRKFDNIINQIKNDNSRELEKLTLLEYVQIGIYSNMFCFFTADSDEEVEQLNNDFVNYVEQLNWS